MTPINPANKSKESSSSSASGATQSKQEKSTDRTAGARSFTADDTLSAIRDDTRTAASSLASDISETARSATAAAKQQAEELASHIGSELRLTAEEQKQHGAEAIKGFGRAIDSAARELEDQSPVIAGYIHDAARQVETLGGSLANRNVNQLLREVSDLARDRPALFFGGAIAAGVIVARFLKSSAPRDGDYGPRHASLAMRCTGSSFKFSARLSITKWLPTPPLEF